MCILLTPPTTSSHNTTLDAQNIDKQTPPYQTNKFTHGTKHLPLPDNTLNHANHQPTSNKSIKTHIFLLTPHSPQMATLAH